ncbi:MAG: PorV/PorQ family protein [candidate division Zixibacteria bacterium]|nr:PorV/PorQ family protein [candidate division Zixibacteria bacterium]
MKTKLVIISLLIIAWLAVPFASAEDEVGGYAGNFLKYDMSARALGMGGAFTALADGAGGVRYNPAGISGIKNTQAGFTYSKLTWDRKLNYAEVLFPLPKQAVIGLSWINAGVSDVKERNSNGDVVGDLKNDENSFNLTFGRRIVENISIGANIRYVHYNFADIVVGTMGIDLGVIGYLLDDNLTAGFKVGNLGSKYSWDTADYYETSGTTYDEEFPKIYRFGLAYKFMEKAFTVAADYEKDEKTNAKFRFGAEYWYYQDAVEEYVDEYTDEIRTRPIKRKFISGRVGYNDGQITFGAGIRHKIYSNFFGKLDYGFSTGALDGLSPDHLITLGIGYY